MRSDLLAQISKSEADKIILEKTKNIQENHHILSKLKRFKEQLLDKKRVYWLINIFNAKKVCVFFDILHGAVKGKKQKPNTLIWLSSIAL